MRFKSSVRILGIRSELLLGLYVADQLWREYGEELTVTSLTDGQHSSGSHHYVGWAADLRLPQNTPAALVAALRRRLPEGWDIILEDTHVHMEFDPRKAARWPGGNE